MAAQAALVRNGSTSCTLSPQNFRPSGQFTGTTGQPYYDRSQRVWCTPRSSKASVRHSAPSPQQRGSSVVAHARNKMARKDEDEAWWEDEVDDWSSPSSAASNLIILLLAFIVATSVIGTLVKLLITCIFLLIEGFKYSAVCIFLMLFAVFLA